MKTVIFLALVGLLAGVAHAGEFYEKDGVAIKGYDPVAYFTEGKPVAGSPEHTFEYKGSTFRFASPANRDTFTADPEKYAPRYGGFCAFGAAGGYKAKIEPEAFTIVDDKLYLNYNGAIQERWRKDVAGYVAKADAKWPEVSRQTKVAQ
jgi:YHS domain-containing protein